MKKWLFGNICRCPGAYFIETLRTNKQINERKKTRSGKDAVDHVCVCVQSMKVIKNAKENALPLLNKC